MGRLSEIPEKIQGTLDLVKEQERRLKVDMGEDGFFDPATVRALHQLSAAVTNLSREGRAWHGKVQKSIESMSLKDQLEVVVNFVQKLSHGDRKKFYDKCETRELERKDRIRFILG